MDENQKLILPGTEGFKEAFDDITQDFNQQPLEIQFSTLTFPKTQAYVEFAVVDVSELLVNINFHFKKISEREMSSIGMALRGAVEDMTVPGLRAVAQVNPTFSKQWDFMLMNIPRASSSMVRSYILTKVKDTFGLIN